MNRIELSNFVLTYVTRQVIAGDFEVSGFRLLMDCPFPDCQTARKRRHFYVNREWYGWRCYRKGEHGSLKDLVLENPRLWSPVRRLDDRGTSRGASSPSLSLADLVPLVEDSPRVFASFRARAYKYALSRGMTPAQIADYKVAAKPLDDRLWFPFWTPDGECTFRMGRILGGEGVKTYEEGLADKPLYGSHVRKPSGFAVLVEGVFDHFATPHSYALMGSAYLTEQQQATLRAWLAAGVIDRVFWLSDPDAKDKARGQVLRARREGFPATACFLEGRDDDPADLGPGLMGRVVNELAGHSASSLRARPFLRCLLPPPRCG
jgi:hypothetical protein